jgi:hypothetical protein
MNELKNVTNKLFKTELESHKVELALADDIKKVSNNLKIAMQNFGELKQEFEKSKTSFKNEADKAYELALKYNAMANDLGLKSMDNPDFKAIDSYLASDLYRNLNK